VVDLIENLVENKGNLDFERRNSNQILSCIYRKVAAKSGSSGTPIKAEATF
jgi:hypothetical protein